MSVRDEQQEKDWKLDWMRRNVEYLQEKLERGEKTITLDIQFVQQLFSENLSWYGNVLYLQRRLIEMACWQQPYQQRIMVPDPTIPPITGGKQA